MPLVSVYTPSHDARFLDEAYDSLNNQTQHDWEWSVVLNRGARWTPPPDRRVKVCHRDVDGVGAAKRAAVAETTGDILVELDHDDLLAPSALEHIAESLEGDVGFVYSDTAQVAEDGSYCSDVFDVTNGWEYTDETVLDRKVMRCHSLEPLPHNASLIWFQPNHLRAFTREAYDAVGGYDESRTILDDQDIISRLYQHTRFKHVDECLYLQRMHNGNTQRDAETNARIQRETIELYDRDINGNALAWASREGLLALDLGAAHNPTPGYVTVDMAGDPDMKGDIFDVLADLPDDSVGVIRAADFLEHIADKIRVFNEAYRVLAHGGMFLTLTPSTDGRGAWQDPTHVAGYNENSFWYFTDAEYAKYVPEIQCRFQVSRLVTYYPSDFHREHHIDYVCCNLTAIKDGARVGGRLLI